MWQTPCCPASSIHDHLPYSDLQLFPQLCALNIGWQEISKRQIFSFIPPRGYLTRPGMPNHDGNHAQCYEGFPALASGTSARGAASQGPYQIAYKA